MLELASMPVVVLVVQAEAAAVVADITDDVPMAGTRTAATHGATIAGIRDHSAPTHSETSQSIIKQ